MSTAEVRDSLLDLAEAITNLADTVQPHANVADTVTEFRNTGRAFTRVGNALAAHFEAMVEDPQFDAVLELLWAIPAEERAAAADAGRPSSSEAVAAFEAGVDRAGEALHGWWHSVSEPKG